MFLECGRPCECGLLLLSKILLSVLFLGKRFNVDRVWNWTFLRTRFATE